MFLEQIETIIISEIKAGLSLSRLLNTVYTVLDAALATLLHKDRIRFLSLVNASYNGWYSQAKDRIKKDLTACNYLSLN